MQLFGGASNQILVKKIGELGVSIGNVNISKFANDEKRVSVGKGSGVAAILQSFSSPVDENIIEFCLLSDALTRAGYSELVGVIPWLGYSKQDKVFLPGEALSAKVIAQIIQTTKIKKLITFDLHNRAITGFFDIPVLELSAKPLFRDYFAQKIGVDTDNCVVVAPDEGAVKASAAIARELGVPIAYMDKRRDLKTGEVSVVGMSGEVAGKHVIIVDDMIVTGSTMMESAEYLKKMGAISVSVAATHHLYLPGVQEKLEKSEIDEVVVSDSVGLMYT
ncbi:MAG: ribose-phosphate pyrophosphokinase, partial [Candidatus Moraniibacteriota bacterium]